MIEMNENNANQNVGTSKKKGEKDLEYLNVFHTFCQKKTKQNKTKKSV